VILGLGNDLCDIRRIEQTLQRFGDRFIDRVFTDVERAKAEAAPATRAARYAKRFAAKEACAKALGTGFRDGIFFKEIGVANLPNGQPVLTLTGAAAARLRDITPPGMVAHLHLTMSDEPPLAQAVVIISAEMGEGADGISLGFAKSAIQI
jgi:holo-[acyl-carrier protein] synthase